MAPLGRCCLAFTALVFAADAVRHRRLLDADASIATEECIQAVEAKGASSEGASACCDLGAAQLRAVPVPMPPSFVTGMAAMFFDKGVCGGKLGQTSEVVQALNAQYSGYDPDDAASSLGVAVHISDSATPYMNETWDMHCEEKCLTAEYPGGVCSIAISILNKGVSKLGESWAGQETLGPLGAEVCMYPGFNKGGVVYTQKAVDASTRCAYAVDAYSIRRPNKGCGCLQEGQFQCTRWPNGTVSGGWGEETDEMITPCKCKSIDQKPFFDKPPGDATCFWEGERMSDSSGQTGIRNAMAQQHKFRESNRKCWNELLLDAQVTNSLMSEDAAGTISAFVIPYPACLGSPACHEQVVATRNFVTDKFGLESPIPIVGLNYMSGDEPFVVLDERLS